MSSFQPLSDFNVLDKRIKLDLCVRWKTPRRDQCSSMVVESSIRKFLRNYSPKLGTMIPSYLIFSGSGDSSFPQTTCRSPLLARALNLALLFSSRVSPLTVIDRSISWVFGSLNVRDKSVKEEIDLAHSSQSRAMTQNCNILVRWDRWGMLYRITYR